MNIEEPNDPETLPSSDSEPRISAEIFCRVFDDHSQFDDFFIIDCRSEREYEGGHIKTAIRCHPFENHESISNLYKRIYRPRRLFIFHCEFSAYRGPSAYHIFQKEHEESKYAENKLHAFVLDGGYSQFYPRHQDYCVGTYVPEVA